MKKLTKRIKKIVLFGFIIGIVAFIFLRHFFYEVPILKYNRIAAYCPQTPLICVSPEIFQKQMDFISRYGYKVISLKELVNALSKKQTLPHNAVVITFDDGYEDIYRNAFAVLKKNRFPATVFVITDFVGKEKFLSWEQLRQMQGQGIDIASHTKTHSYLPDTVDEQRLWNEIFESKKELENQIDRPINLFSYPTGGYNYKIIDFVRRAGYIAACTTNRGRYHLNPDIYALRRIKMTNHSDNLFVMWIKLSGIYNLFRRR